MKKYELKSEKHALSMLHLHTPTHRFTLNIFNSLYRISFPASTYSYKSLYFPGVKGNKEIEEVKKKKDLCEELWIRGGVDRSIFDEKN
jgi:hypothetical protein